MRVALAMDAIMEVGSRPQPSITLSTRSRILPSMLAPSLVLSFFLSLPLPHSLSHLSVCLSVSLSHNTCVAVFSRWQRLSERAKKPMLAFLCSPTDVFVVPTDAQAAMKTNLRKLPLSVKIASVLKLAVKVCVCAWVYVSRRFALYVCLYYFCPSCNVR